MSNILINEFLGINPISGFTPTPQAAGDILTTQAIAIGGASVQSAPINTNTGLVRVYAEARCSILYGANPVVTATNGIAMEANTYDYFRVSAGSKIAVIQRA